MTRLVLRRHDMNPVDLELYQWQQAAFFFLERELGVNLWFMLQHEHVFEGIHLALESP